jgi:cytoskeletal protein CcmA (bactofilin family)
VQNSLGSIVARFQNDYKCLLDGNTTVTGNISGSGELYVAGPVFFNQTLAVTGNATVAGALTVGGTSVKTALDGLSTNYYTKTQVNETFANFIDSAPAALNTLKELASALGNGANYAASIQSQLALKAPKTYATFTGSLNADDIHATSVDLTGTLVVGGNASAGRLATNPIIGNGATQITIDNDVIVRLPKLDSDWYLDW